MVVFNAKLINNQLTKAEDLERLCKICYGHPMLEGLPPNNAAYVMRILCTQEQARAIADLFVETFDPAETAAAAFEETPSTEDWSTGPWVVEVFFADEPDQDMMRDLVTVAAGEQAAQDATFGRIEERNWVASSLEGLVPVRAGRFLVHGAHDRSDVRSNDIGLEIEAALAFGTGHHGTTYGCLMMLDHILRQYHPRSILDVGTGTGVLALAAARYLHRSIWAGDIDPIAVEAATSNARLNHAHPWLKPVTARGLMHPHLRAGAPYDLIFANILAKPLRLLAPSIARASHRHTDLVLSGLLARDVPGVLSAYRAQGFSLAKRVDYEGWATLRLKKGGSDSRPLS
jgi:ribosomal protein L11 methyltransferase